jgi:AAA+ ATPase superfamily predicted ATPase
MKKFYNRYQELQTLRNISEGIGNGLSKLSVLVGFRRVGKTRLINEAFKNTRHIYFFVSKKSEKVLVQEFTDIIASECNAKFFSPRTLIDVIEFLLDYSTHNPITVIIDEFQDIRNISPSFYSDLQNLWDKYRQNSHMHLVTCGSIYSLMTKIFKGDDEPLFNRHDHYFNIRPLTPSFIQEVLVDEKRYSPQALLTWWSLSGGIPKYLEWLSNTIPSKDTFAQLVNEFSPLLDEGRHRLVDDFSEEHRTYFDILGAIASGKNTKPEIEDYIGVQVNETLDNLVSKFDLVRKFNSMDAKPKSRGHKYQINDAFLRFWFKFIYKNRSAVEMNNYEYILKIIERDFQTFAGHEFEYLITEILKESKQFNRIGSFWDRKGHNEIDVVAVNNADKRVLFIEAKLQYKNYEPAKFEEKINYAISQLKLFDYEVTYQCVALDSLDSFIKKYIPKPPDDVYFRT